MKSIRILLTDKCNANCANCLNRDIRIGATYMDTGKLLKISNYLRSNGVKNVRVMGGEPTLHPDFKYITGKLQNIFNRVTVFTNGISNKLCYFIPREKDSVNYNSKFINSLNEERLLVGSPGNRLISVVVDKTLNVEYMIGQILRVSKLVHNVKISLSFDCTDNIFRDRSLLVEKYKTLYDICIKLGLEVIMDHALPICFLYNTGIVVNSAKSICDTGCSGLIDAQFNLRFCNLTSDDKLSLFNKERIIPYKIIENFLQMAYYRKQVAVLDKICLHCTLYGEYCNGGCFIQNKNITRKDILQNTDFPTNIKI